MALDARVPGKESKQAAERLSRILAEGVPDIQEDLRYNYVKEGLQVIWGTGQGEERVLLSFAQLHDLTDEELHHLIRSSLSG